jgi:hypothetical protein
MRFIICFFIIFKSLTQDIQAQGFDFNNPFGFSYKLPKALNEDTNGLMIQYSQIGEYQKTLEIADLEEENSKSLSKDDSLYFKKFKAQAAIPFLLNQTKDKKIVIINESHHNQMHRVFTTQLLQGLYNQGFRYFGLEGLTTSSGHDARINKEKYPTLASGYYTVEPQFGNLIREALQMGFEIFSYENSRGGSGKPREIGQAKNIQAFINKHTDGKLLIHCGYDHVVEADTFGSWGKAMAGRLKEFTGIDPFTIDQVALTERSNPSFENPFFKIINEDTPSVFVDEKGEIFNGTKGQNYVDARIYHPRTKYINGRPDWLIIKGRKWVKFSTKDIKIEFPCLVIVYIAEEPDYAVPCDVMVLNSKQEQKALALKKGNYRVKVINEKEEFQIVSITLK